MERTKQEVYARAERFIEAARKSVKHRDAGYRLDDITLHTDGYAERGYSDPDSGVIATGNWNRISRWDETERKSITVDDTLVRLANLFEKLGIELEWSDEWTTCENCRKLVRTQPDSYGWTKSSVYIESHGDVCEECAAENPAEILEALEISHVSSRGQMLELEIDPEEHGYKRVNDEDYENGFYGGQDANPDDIVVNLLEQGCTRILCKLTDRGQFDMKFAVYIHESEWEKFSAAKLKKAEHGTDPAEMLKNGLQAAAIQGGGGPGIHVTHVNLSDGTAETKTITPQEFIDGKALKR